MMRQAEEACKKALGADAAAVTPLPAEVVWK
jgi:hypothetical protein